MRIEAGAASHRRHPSFARSRRPKWLRTFCAVSLRCASSTPKSGRSVCRSSRSDRPGGTSSRSNGPVRQSLDHLRQAGIERIGVDQFLPDLGDRRRPAQDAPGFRRCRSVAHRPSTAPVSTATCAMNSRSISPPGMSFRSQRSRGGFSFSISARISAASASDLGLRRAARPGWRRSRPRSPSRKLGIAGDRRGPASAPCAPRSRLPCAGTSGTHSIWVATGPLLPDGRRRRSSS